MIDKAFLSCLNSINYIYILYKLIFIAFFSLKVIFQFFALVDRSKKKPSQPFFLKVHISVAAEKKIHKSILKHIDTI